MRRLCVRVRIEGPREEHGLTPRSPNPRPRIAPPLECIVSGSVRPSLARETESPTGFFATYPQYTRGDARSQSTSAGAAHKGCGASRCVVARARPSGSPRGSSCELGLSPTFPELRAQLDRRASQSSFAFVGMRASTRKRSSISLEGLSRQRDYARTRTTLRRWKADIGSTVTKCLDEALI